MFLFNGAYSSSGKQVEVAQPHLRSYHKRLKLVWVCCCDWLLVGPQTIHEAIVTSRDPVSASSESQLEVANRGSNTVQAARGKYILESISSSVYQCQCTNVRTLIHNHTCLEPLGKPCRCAHVQYITSTLLCQYTIAISPGCKRTKISAQTRGFPHSNAPSGS